jgi:serine/threonine protein kinase
LETNCVERNPTVDDLLQRWTILKEQSESATIEDLCSDDPEGSADLKERLQAIASMMSFLGIEADLGPIASSSTEIGVRDISSSTVEGECSELAVDRDVPAKSVRIPGYEVLGELGRGGMGVVYLARQISLNRVVALKEILIGDHSNPSQIARFRNEGLTVARLRHPNIVQVYEVGEHDGLPFITFEYIRGSSLDRKLTGAPIPSSEAAALIAALARGISVAHEHGIVHRDLKPGNVLLDDQLPGVPGPGVPKVTDFGLAKLVNDQSGLTRTDTVLGSPSYMAPEQAEGKNREVGASADIYALGAILYELLTGRPPFRGATVLDTIQQVKTAEPVPPSRLVPGVPRDAETIVLKCLQKEPTQRYPTAAALADDLDRFLRGEPIAARPIGHWERACRWCRRNKVVAASLATVALSLLTATVVSVLFGLRADRARQAEAEGRHGETKAKQEAVQARRDVQQQLIDLSTEAGLAAAREEDHALALLWFARTAQLSSGYHEREELSRTRYANWLRPRGIESNAVCQLAPARLDPGGHDGDPGLSPGAGPIPAVDVLARWELSRGHSKRRQLPALGPGSGPARLAHGARGWGRGVGTNVWTAGRRQQRWHDPRAGAAGLHTGRRAAGRRRCGCLDVQPRRSPTGLGRYQRRPDLGPGDETVFDRATEARRAGRYARLQRGWRALGDLGTRLESPCFPVRFRADGSRLPTSSPCTGRIRHQSRRPGTRCASLCRRRSGAAHSGAERRGLQPAVAVGCQRCDARDHRDPDRS